MSRPASDPAFSLQSEQHATRALIELLQSEQDKLIEGSIDGLDALLERKSTLIAQLTVLTKSRHTALADSGFNASEIGMRGWLTGASRGDAEHHWQALLGLGAEAKELNRINGMLIGRHLIRGQTELNILQGKPQHSNFYGPDGQSAGKGLGRGLVIG